MIPGSLNALRPCGGRATAMRTPRDRDADNRDGSRALVRKADTIFQGTRLNARCERVNFA